jgi:hypothetical protein
MLSISSHLVYYLGLRRHSCRKSKMKKLADFFKDSIFSYASPFFILLSLLCYIWLRWQIEQKCHAIHFRELKVEFLYSFFPYTNLFLNFMREIYHVIEHHSFSLFSNTVGKLCCVFYIANYESWLHSTGLYYSVQLQLVKNIFYKFCF